MADAVKRDRLPWHDGGTWLVGDPHCHYRLVGMDQLVARAADRLDFMGLTEHGHMSDAFSAQAALVEKARHSHPGLVLINGVQWEAPIGDSITVLAPGGLATMPVLLELLKRFDGRVAGIKETQENLLAALRFLSEHAVSGVPPAAIVQHPHGDRGYGADRLREALDAGAALAGFAVSSANRHDSPGGGILLPWLTDIGGVLDMLFAEGRRLVMTADSDFHSPEGGGVWGQTKFWPGEYRRTHLFCPEKTEAGVFAGLRSGACYVVVGNLVSDFDFHVSAGDRTAMLGERLETRAGTSVTVTTRLVRTGKIESLQLIGNPGGKARVLAEARGDALLEEDGVVTWSVELEAGPGTWFVRVMGRGEAADPAGVPAALATAAVWVNGS